jgi:hypothetical protein
MICTDAPKKIHLSGSQEAMKRQLASSPFLGSWLPKRSLFEKDE